jgi:hypothetical protein
MVYMASTARSILWGGGGLNVFGDTWEWDGEGWVQVEDTGPAPSALVGLAFDSDRNVAVLFTQTDTAWETWEWDCSTWTQVEDSGPQAAQGAFQMVYDRARQLTVLEGGEVQNGPAQPAPVGTWVWDAARGRRWLMSGHRSVLTAPSATTHPANASFTSAGSTSSTRHTRAIRGNGTETPGNRSQNMGPAARAAHAMTGTSAATLLFGGIAPVVANTPRELFRDTWTWDGEHWHQRQDIGPSPRFWPALSWDDERSRGVLFGGGTLVAENLTYLNDTWESFETA